MPQILYKEWQLLSGLHLVLVDTTYGRFTFSIKQDK